MCDPFCLLILRKARESVAKRRFVETVDRRAMSDSPVIHGGGSNALDNTWKVLGYVPNLLFSECNLLGAKLPWSDTE